jgi:hypothetical protein
MINRNYNNIPPPSHHYRRFHKEFCTQKMKANKSTREWEVSNQRRRKDNQKVAFDSAAYNQILKQQKQLNSRNHHIPININTECQQTQLPHQKTLFGRLKRKI